MKTQLTHAGDFVRQVELQAIAAQAGSFHMQFSSQLTSARNPDEWQRNFGLVLKKEELLALRDLINTVLV
jgi:hypothetical protein